MSDLLVDRAGRRVTTSWVGQRSLKGRQRPGHTLDSPGPTSHVARVFRTP